MEFSFTDQQAMIRRTMDGFIAEHGAEKRVRRAMESSDGFDRESWRALAGDMGLAGAAIAERWGGAGLGHVELASIVEIAGARLFPSPLIASAGMAAAALVKGDNDGARAGFLPAIADGSLIATLAGSPEAPFRLEGGVISGTDPRVPFGHAAGLLLVIAADTRGALHIIPVDPRARGVSVTRRTSMDMTRPVSGIAMHAVAADLDRGIANGAEAAAHARSIGAMLIAADAAGGAAAILDITAAYAKQRVQFGRPIGSFQAVKHRLADMMVRVETARSLAFYAACTADEDPASLAEAASVAKVGCTEAMHACAADMIQLHGGIGFTWDHVAHLYFKRARNNLSALGSADWHRERIMQCIEAGATA